jgi:hypothetical protein
MTFRLKIAFVLNILVSIALIAFSLRYLLSSQIMPYHLQVIGRSWNDLDPRLQMMLLGLLGLGGIGQLSTGITLGILTLIPFRRGQKWAYWAIPIIGFIYGTPIAYGAYALHHSTQAATPWKEVVIILLVLLVAYLLTVRSAAGVYPLRGDKKAVA